jgi:hypothetical protein
LLLPELPPELFLFLLFLFLLLEQEPYVLHELELAELEL